MANTAFSTKIPDSDCWHVKLTRNHICNGPLWLDPRLRPPILEEMMPDLERVIASMAWKYHDVTTPFMHYDELVGEGRLKLAELISKGELYRQISRYDFFRFFTACVSNMARSRLQKYRFTEKRTGQKPPPRDQRFAPPVEGAAPGSGHDDDDDDDEPPQPEYHKNVELSLDDPELNVQVANASNQDQQETREVEAEYEALLTDTEILVFRQLHQPNAKACCLAQLDAWRKRNDQGFNIKLKNEHLAEGLGMDPKDFGKYVLTIRQKITAYRNMNNAQLDEQSHQNVLIATLSQLFGIQIPANLHDDMVVRRLFTMAARNQYEEKVKGKPEVEEMLIEIGAKPPRMIGNIMSCYGILYSRNCRKCNMCDMRDSCRIEAANLGLTTVAISPRLLGRNQERIPACLPHPADNDFRVSSSDEQEIIAYLDDSFSRRVENESIVYYGEDPSNNRHRVLFTVDNTSPLRLRFSAPSDKLKTRLVSKQKAWQPRDCASLAEIFALVEQHAKEALS